jgi:hypothetical protein
MTKPLYFYNGTTFEQVGPTTPQSPIAYQTSAPTGPATGDLWIDSDGDVDTYNRQLTRYYFVATAGQTTITGIDANGLTLAYVAGSEAVYINGALQVRGQDYTATNGTSVTGLTALAVNDVVEIFAYTAFTVANAYTKTETDSVAAAAAGLRMVVPTSITVGSGTGSVSANGTITFSGASSISVNGCFSSTYDNYLIVGYGTNTDNDYLNIRMRVGGVDNSTASSYITQLDEVYNTSQDITRVTQTSGRIARWFTTRGGFSATVYEPFLAVTTSIRSAEKRQNTQLGDFAIHHTQEISYDGISFIPNTGTATGTIQIYGYKD